MQEQVVQFSENDGFISAILADEFGDVVAEGEGSTLAEALHDLADTLERS